MKKQQIQKYYEDKSGKYWEIIEPKWDTLKEAKQAAKAFGGKIRILEIETRVVIKIIE